MVESKKKVEKTAGRLSLFFALFLCLFQIFITFPIAVWKRNKFNLEAPLTHSFSVIMVTLGVVVLISCLVALFVPRKYRPVLSLLFTVLAALIFIQQNFLNWNYGILDGQDLRFKQNFWLGLVDIAFWLGGIGLLIFAHPIIRRQTSNILTAVGLIAVIMAAMNVVSYGPAKTLYTVDERSKFEFSKSKNIIVFLFDAFQMDLLLELIETNPELAEPFEGFTAYDNNAAVFAKTYPTVPLFLTGKRYQKKEPLLDFFDTAYDDSLMEKMQKEGWDIGIYPNTFYYPSLINAIKISPSIMDNAIGGVPSNAKIDTYLRTLDLSFFRAVPHFVKPIIFNKGQFVTKPEGIRSAYLSAIGQNDDIKPFRYKHKQNHPALDFKSLLKQHGKVEMETPAFRFYHFIVPHAPNRLDENLNLVKNEESFEAYYKYSTAGLKLMGAYLESLKSLEAYDNATIIILSDHGMGTQNRLQYDPKTKAYETIKKYGLQRSAAKSILLIKNPNESGPLKISSKAVSGIDIAPTIAATANIDIGQVEGLDINTFPENLDRPRLFNYYTFSTWDSKYLDVFDTYEIKGHIRDEAAWKRLGKVKADIKLENSKYYKIGELVSFGTDVKNDSDHLNNFITSEDFTIQPNFVNAPMGDISLSMKMKNQPKMDETLLLQFEIYSGAAIDRKILVNGHEKTALLTPKRRKLNDGFIIPPEIHKGSSSFNLSFKPISADMVKPLHLSSVKISIYDPSSQDSESIPLRF